MTLENKKVLVTGGNSYLGRFLVEELEKKGAKINISRSRDYDLTTEDAVARLFEDSTPQVVMHLAVDCGGFKYKKENPGSMFFRNIMMNTLVQEYSLRTGVEKFVGIGTSASYPESASAPLKEDDLWEGLPEEFNHSYGLVKRIMGIQSKVYRQQYGLNAIHLLPVNLYGPNSPLDPNSIRIIPIFLRDFIEAKRREEKNIILSGTPNASREFLYVDDCVRAIILATERYDKSNPVNIGSGETATIRDLAEKVKRVVEFKGEIIWDEVHSDEQPGRVVDTSRAEKEFGFKSQISLEEGLKKTRNWYLNRYKSP